MRRLLTLLAGTVTASLASAQQYVDERVAFGGSPSTSSGADVIHGDVDGDGILELIVRNFASTDWVLRGGPGGFEFVDIVGGSDSNDSIVVDLTGDGRGDLLTQDFVNLGYFRGEAGATLGSFVNIQAEGTNEVFWTKRAGDVNGDGKVDVVVSLSTDAFGSTGVLRWFAGNGAGAFTAPKSTASTPYPLRFELGDFDADGDLDAAATGPSGAAAFVFAGTGVGFSAPVPVAPSGADARLLAVGDFDADGIDDLACYPSSAAFSWFRGGAGGLSPGGSLALPGATAAGRDLVAADLDQDGADDLLLVESVANNGRVWRSFGAAGTGLAAPAIALAIPCSSVDACEWDGKPGLDLSYIALSTIWPVLRPGDGAGGFVAPTDLLAPGSCTDADSACAGDIDRDGALDLAFESGTWLRGAGDGTFLPAAPLGARPSELVDLNGDGRLDAIGLLQACAGSTGLNVSLAHGSSFAAASLPPQPAAGTLAAFAIADVDADGDLDLASAGKDGAFTHRNNGNGSFAPFVTTTLPPKCTRIGAGDLNGDGLPDLAVGTVEIDPIFGNVTKATLAWGLSNGSGQVTGVQSKTLFNAALSQIVIEDANGDALPDVVFAQGSIAAANGDGAGNLGSLNTLAIPPSPAPLSLAFADVDGDGLRDVVAGGGPQTQVTIARRTATGYALWREIASGAGAGRLLPYDFDADGQIDLAWNYGATVRLALNRKDDPAGTAPFGTGTPGCLGRASIGTVQPAKIGNAKFRLLANHLPPHAQGWFLLGSSASPGGFDPFGVGILMHVDPLPPAVFVLVPSVADSSGHADLAAPIPFDPTLVGASFTVQAVHTGALATGLDCSTSPLSLVSSRGLSLTIQS